MDDKICIKFHFGGSFTSVGGAQFYVGGDIAESWIEVDKLSFFEIKGHLSDHYNPPSVLRLFWLKPGKHVSNGLVLLQDDSSCQAMNSLHSDGSCVHMYVEEVAMEISADIWVADDGGDVVSCDDELGEDEGGDDEEGDASAFDDMPAHDLEMQYPAQPSDKGKGVVEEEDGDEDYCTDSSFDEDYKQPAEDDSSADDEETNELRIYAMQIKRNIRAKKLGVHGGQVGNIVAQDIFDEVPNLDDPGSPYVDSSQEYSYDENSDGETERWKSLENRFDSKAEVPIFSLGMAFRDSRQFKKALVKYGIKAHRSLRFPIDEKNKVRAECDWQGCQWFIYGSITTRSKWLKVVTFNDVHTCPPTRENKLVTSGFIAKHYFQQIKDNPTWKPILIKAAVQKDLFADVSISKCKRAKSLVLQKALDAMKGEYNRIYDYQLELQRSNPGSTVVVCLDPDIEDKHVFERFYVCFDGLRRGFLAGCRKVIGLDGCWFKGANNGNLLCAIGRDANNQMYPIAWAAVPIENYDTWYWFLSLLQKDLCISNGGEDWVLISDQQKVNTSQFLLFTSHIC